MSRRHVRRLALIFALVLALSGLFVAVPAAASPTGHDAFLDTWARSDLPVAAGQVSRTWMWGPEPFTPPLREPYVEAPGGSRLVQYFDKTRMEITDPAGDRTSPWYVTNGLLAKELVTGQLQLGDATFEPHPPAQVNVAGDPDDPDAPTYASFSGLLTAPPLAPGQQIAPGFAVSVSRGRVELVRLRPRGTVTWVEEPVQPQPPAELLRPYRHAASGERRLHALTSELVEWVERTVERERGDRCRAWS